MKKLIDDKIIFRSIVTKKLSKKEIKKICSLKDKQWRFGIKSQIKWFEDNVKKNDYHNLFYVKSKLVGYTLLRKRTCLIGNLNKKDKYILFDTMVIDKSYRKKKLSNLLMNFNNKVIKKLGFFSFLICKDELVNFYFKNKWKILHKKKFFIADKLHSLNGMIYNKLHLDKKTVFYTNS